MSNVTNEEKPQAGGGGRGGHSQPRQGGRVHEQATHARRLVAAGQPLEVPGGRDAGQDGAAPRPDPHQLRLRQGSDEAVFKPELVPEGPLQWCRAPDEDGDG